MSIRVVCLSVLLLACHGLAWADDEPKFGIGARVGATTGFGFDASYGLNPWVDLRGGFNFGYVEFDEDEDGNEYRAKLSYRSYSGLVDFKPFAGAFRLTAGLYSKPFALKMKALSQDDFEVNDRTYNGDLNARAKLSFGSAVPYLGIGWGGTTNGNGFGASFDFGVQITRSPNVSLKVDGRACDASVDENCDPAGAQGFDVNGSDLRAQAFQADLDQEVHDIEHDAKDFRVIPVATLGLHYRFGLGRSHTSAVTTPAADTPPPSASSSSSMAAPAIVADSPAVKPTPVTAAPAGTAKPVTRAPAIAAKPAASSVIAKRAFVIRAQPMMSSPPTARIAAGTAYVPGTALSNKYGVWRFVQGDKDADGWVLDSELKP